MKHNSNERKKAVIIGAGPAGLTAAYELLKKTDIKPIILEKTGDIGGISKTVNYKGNRMDMGGHRFFSKSEKIMNWWFNILPLQNAPAKDEKILNQQLVFMNDRASSDPEKSDKVMLKRRRTSRIFFQKKFFDYPVTLSVQTIKKLGFIKSVRIIFSYLQTRIHPIKNECSLEDFYINRFGRELYQIFFKDYTKKLWGVACTEIKPDWGRQRVKGLSIKKVFTEALKNFLFRNNRKRKTETSLIRQFYYPKFGPGQLWEEVAAEILKMGGEIRLRREAVGVKADGKRIISVNFMSGPNGKMETEEADFFISTMPIRDLIKSFSGNVSDDVLRTAQSLMYRDFVSIGLLVNKMKIKNESKIKTINNIIPDNWLYVQDSSVKLGRIQVFNNWSPYLVKNFESEFWLGLEYFCSEGDFFWNMADSKIIEFAAKELSKIGITEENSIIDGTVARVEKAYPSYFGGYERLGKIKKFTNNFENLFLIGRNGMHRYNNMDHSMLSAMAAVENIISGTKSKENIWTINTEDEYHEEKNNG